MGVSKIIQLEFNKVYIQSGTLAYTHTCVHPFYIWYCSHKRFLHRKMLIFPFDRKENVIPNAWHVLSFAQAGVRGRQPATCSGCKTRRHQESDYSLEYVEYVLAWTLCLHTLPIY